MWHMAEHKAGVLATALREQPSMPLTRKPFDASGWEWVRVDGRKRVCCDSCCGSEGGGQRQAEEAWAGMPGLSHMQCTCVRRHPRQVRGEQPRPSAPSACYCALPYPAVFSNP